MFNNKRRRRRDFRYRKNDKNEAVPCSICQKPIRDPNTALDSQVTGALAHFDCVIQEITVKEDLQENEKVYYLGKGTFGVIKLLNYSSSPVRFIVKKRISYIPINDS